VFIFVSPFVAAQLRISHCNEQFKRMANVVCEISVTRALLAAQPSDIGGAGAVIDFWGVVRPVEEGREIEGIDYEAHREMAEHQLKRIAEQAADRFDLKLVIVHHRIGFIAVGEASLFVQVATLHRGEGFRASQWIVNQLKKSVPIWKRPVFSKTTAGKPHLTSISAK
jgi:molybdopterin synthase catalytic subunit